MGLIGHNKRFLAATVNAPGSTHDARLLKSTEVFKGILDGQVLPNKSINLGDKFGEIPLVTVGDSAFPRYAWLVKGFSDTTRNEKERLFNEKLRSARVVTENCYGMLKRNFIQINRCEISEFKVCNFTMYFASQSLYCNERPM